MSSKTLATSHPSTRPPNARRRLITDRIARAIVTGGGMAIVASVLGILLFILWEVLPVFDRVQISARDATVIDAQTSVAMITDEYRTHVVALGADGMVRTLALGDPATREEVALLPVAAAKVDGGGVSGGPAPAALPVAAGLSAVPLRAVHAASCGSMFAASTNDGSIVLAPVSFDETFAGSVRNVTPRLGAAVVLDVDPGKRPIDVFWAEMREGGASTVVAQIDDRTIMLVERKMEQNEFTGEVKESIERRALTTPQPLSQLLVDQAGRNVYGGTERGDLLWWCLEEGAPGAPQVVGAGNSAITAFTLLLGDRSLVVGQRNGSLSVWLHVRDEQDAFRLVRVRDFPARASAIRHLAASHRGKVFLAVDTAGVLGLYHSTSARTLWTGSAPAVDVAALTFAPKADGAFVLGDGKLHGLDIHCPHPEISPAALFLPVWYEDAPRPECVWQSGGTEDFEPKLSLTPLLFGTLKGTFYSLLLAIPIAVLAAMYASQFMHPRLKRFVKPVVEIMAALPSVVLGFLAGLWLAPRVERMFPSLLLMLLVLPAMVIATGVLWSLVPRRIRGRFTTGSEVFLFALALVIGGALCLALNQSFGTAVFGGGGLSSWLLEATGLKYDQRNAIVVGLAMGFAVIPIIFAIAEDAFSNVPPNLIAGSLALGADRWQTVTRVVLPTASPGIFSAIMVGFGRAVGETMIVLMAAGNTAIMSWNPFDGFRTLSANIATEIPEAAHGSTLYRTLFLAALLLFALTFVVNTVAEVVRQSLRRRYAQL